MLAMEGCAAVGWAAVDCATMGWAAVGWAMDAAMRGVRRTDPIAAGAVNGTWRKVTDTRRAR